MRRFDLSPLFRSTIGFDRYAALFDAVNRLDEQQNAYPPYNIEKTAEDRYRVTLAVAGFAPEDLSLVAQSNSLVVTARTKRAEESTAVLHRGIAGRAFVRRFDLADYIRVVTATLEHGLLHIDLVREIPEAMKPRDIQIQAIEQPRALDQHAA